MDTLKSRSQLDAFLAQTRQNQLRLTHITDNKAHILIVISAVTLNLAVMQLRSDSFRVAAVMLTLQSLLTIVFASLSIMPARNAARPPSAPIRSSFAADLAANPYEAYLQQMRHVLQSEDATYEIQLREIYDGASILMNRKLKYLRWAFVTFLAGTTLTTLVAIAESVRG